MDILTITITNKRAIDGFVFEANRNEKSVIDYVTNFVETQGIRNADDNRIAVITSAAFIKKFTPTEYSNILSACEPVSIPVPVDLNNPTEQETLAINQAITKNTIASAISELIDQLTESPNIALDDSRLRPGLSLLVNVGLLDVSRIDDLLSYPRPQQDF